MASAAAGSDAAAACHGQAPAADLYDVCVLDERGVGNMGDVLAAIDRVMPRARLAKLRVMTDSDTGGGGAPGDTARPARRAQVGAQGCR